MQVWEEDEQLHCVADAVRRGRMLRCKVCGEKGATMGCVLKTCKKSFHLPCARATHCALQVQPPLLSPCKDPLLP